MTDNRFRSFLLALKISIEDLLCEDNISDHAQPVTKHDMHKLEERLTMKLSEIKTAISTASKQNREAFTELSGKIADLQKQIDDLIAGAGDPDVTDEAFLADLNSLKSDAQALADIVPNPVPPPPVT